MAEINDTIRFDFRGATETWKVPKDVKRIKIEVYGARGGGSLGGYGGKTWGQLNVTEGQILYVTVGERPTGYELGGFNGGGNAGTNDSGSWGGAGGGATDVRKGGTGISKRIIVAGGGGGGGSGSSFKGGAGGGLVGSTGGGDAGGSGGTQTEGGVNVSRTSLNATVIGVGGNGGSLHNTSYYGGGAGGGGYYGGAGGSYGQSGKASAGGGGSSYYGDLENVGTTSGANTGNGYAVITILEMDYAKFTIHNDTSNVSDGNKILEYTLDSNLAELTVVEKVDSVVVATRTLKTGERNTLSIPKEQWDSLAYGKYRSSSSALHTITLENDYNTANFNFTKSISSEAGLSEILKSIEDANNSIIPSIKTKIATKSKATKEATFEDLIAGITLENMGGVKWASGSDVFLSDVNNRITPVVTGLDFTPRFVLLSYPNSSQTYDRVHILDSRFGTRSSTSKIIVEGKGFRCNSYLGGSSSNSNQYIYWMAIE